MLYVYELRKILLNKVSLILLSTLLIFNIFTTFLNLDDNNISRGDVANIIEIYADDTTEYYKIYGEIQSSYQSAITNSYVLESFDFSSTKHQSDYELFEIANSYISYFESYPEKIHSVLKEAQLRKFELESKNENLNSFSYLYQNKVLDIYSEHSTILSNDDIFHYGWKDFFEYSIINLFTYISVVILGGQIINTEKSTGMLRIIRTTKKGRRHLIFIKILVACTIAIFLTLVFNISSLSYIYITCGLSSPSSPIQIIPHLSLVPWSLNIIETVLILLFVRCLAAVVLILFVFLISVFFDYLLTYLFSLFILASNFLLSITSSAFQIKYCNLFSFASPDIFSRYRSFWFADNCVNVFLFAILFYIITICLLILLLITQKNYIHKDRIPPSTVRVVKKLKTFRRSSFYIVPSKFFHNTYGSEILKNYRTFMLVFIVLLVRILFILQSPAPSLSYSEILYQDYMEQLYGDFTPEKAALVLDEKKHIANILSKETSMRVEYELGYIDEATYRQYQEEFYYCSERSAAIDKVYTHTLYLENAASSLEFRPVYFYDAGLTKLFDTNLDPYIITIIFIVCGSIFRPEYLQTSSSSAFCNIIRSTPKGRRYVYHSKYTICILSIFIIVLSVTISDATIITSQYHIWEYDHIIWNADIKNIELYNNCFVSTSCGSYYILTCILRMAGYLMISSICFCISNLCEKALQTYGTIITLTLIPLALSTIGTKAIFAINILSICNPNDLFLTSKHFYLPYMVAFLLLVPLNFRSKRKWDGITNR